MSGYTKQNLEQIEKNAHDEEQRLNDYISDLEKSEGAKGKIIIVPCCPICSNVRDLVITEIEYKLQSRSKILQRDGKTSSGYEMLCQVCGFYAVAPVDAHTFFMSFDRERLAKTNKGKLEKRGKGPDGTLLN